MRRFYKISLRFWHWLDVRAERYLSANKEFQGGNK